MTDAQIKYMVDRFLCWRLPEHFNPDGGISFKRTFNEHTAHPMKNEPSGTNLFDAMQADAMVRHMIDGMSGNDLDNPFWLIERYVNGRLCFWSAGARGRSSRDDWSEDVEFATRLSSHASAEQVLIHTCGGEGRCTRHLNLPKAAAK